MSKIVFFRERVSPGFYIKFNFDQNFIEVLKLSVPSSSREWHPDRKLWWVGDLYFSTILRLAHRFFDEVSDQTRPDPEPEYRPDPPPSWMASPHGALFLLPNAPQPVVKAAYKALAKMYHPDAGGDPERMRVINLAFEAIEESEL